MYGSGWTVDYQSGGGYCVETRELLKLLFRSNHCLLFNQHFFVEDNTVRRVGWSSHEDS